MAEFKKTETGIKDLVIIDPAVCIDQRGFFMETYSKREFEKIGISTEFVQDNHSRSKKGVLRGLHFQTKHQQGKLIRVTRGSIWDVAVDLRKGSQTFGRWYGLVLSEENRKMIYIPKGFAHGFLSLEDNTEIQYKCTDFYYPEYDAGISWDDPDIDIKWPFEEFELAKEKIVFSLKDRGQPSLKEYLGEIK
ncbi:dTDP-4-dehydrorhamnose 3,5-epimerase [uncultured Ilyobacter sp.]|uniref:dTDP-4-dehydrorhamnose 3,5-epimerase n=1 Tax=uncultured Ilyobacter sp. TaxID=544433 RepID=UPI0029C672D7|nr:dTDP-4-dehydrorhamnose 3,5-epimerase [uncultured Ilyobacter sp.]